jgi:hypothetical protein
MSAGNRQERRFVKSGISNRKGFMGRALGETLQG